MKISEYVEKESTGKKYIMPRWASMLAVSSQVIKGSLFYVPVLVVLCANGYFVYQGDISFYGLLWRSLAFSVFWLVVALNLFSKNLYDDGEIDSYLALICARLPFPKYLAKTFGKELK